MLYFIRTLPRALLTCFAPRFLPYHLSAIVLTYMLVITGIDWDYYLFIYNSPYHLVFVYLSFAAGMVGFLLPLTMPAIALGIGYIKNDKVMIHTAYAVAAAGIIVSIIAGGYKAITGRAHPPVLPTEQIQNVTHQFDFGFFQHGVFWGWPSSHTAVAFAMSVTLWYLYRRNKYFDAAMLLYALAIGIGVSFNFHWFSDFVAGVIIGSLVGHVVGTMYKKSPAFH